jgi:hypothetical protein
VTTDVPSSPVDDAITRACATIPDALGDSFTLGLTARRPSLDEISTKSPTYSIGAVINKRRFLVGAMVAFLV